MKLSIITINLNNSKGLIDTFNTVSKQSFQDFEYIVIDGKSTDGSISLINSEKRIDHSLSEKDTGVYDAMNKGIKLAKGEYLLFLNSGDCLYNDQTLNNIISYLSDTDIVYGDLIFQSAHSSQLYKYPEELSINFLFELSLAHPATFIKRNLFDKFGLYDTDYKITADWTFFLKCILKGNVSTKHINEIISIFDTNGMSSNPSNMEQIHLERETFLTKEFSLVYKQYLKDKTCIQTLIEKEKNLERIQSSRYFRLLKRIGYKKFN